MKNVSLYKIPIAYMLVYVVFILSTGIWLFLLSQGLNSSDGVMSTIMSIVNSPEPKSVHNFIEVAAPHMFAIGAMVFVVSHFMLFSTKISQKTSLLLIYLTIFMQYCTALTTGKNTKSFSKLTSLVFHTLIILIPSGNW